MCTAAFALVALSLPAAASAATITVTTNADDLTPNDGTVSLREAVAAIDAGNTLGDPDISAESPGVFGTNDTIQFAGSLSGQTIVLNGGGELAITKPVRISGPGAGALTVSGNDAHRVFHVTAPSGNTTILDLTVTGGAFSASTTAAGGAGIANDGNGALTLSGVRVTGNTATLSGNVADQGGAGVFNFGNGALTILDSQITGNDLSVTGTSGFEKGGGGVFTRGSQLYITGSAISGNVANLAGSGSIGGGGLLLSTSGASTSIADTTFDGNHVTTATGTSGGGAIFDDVGNLYLTSSTLSGNTATITAGGDNRGGGAVFEDGGNLFLLNSTVAGNTATVTGGSGNAPGGGGIFANAGLTNVSIASSTIAGNGAPGQHGGGIDDNMTSNAPTNGRVSLLNTIVAGNSAASGGNCYDATNFPASGLFTSLGHNLESTDTCNLRAAGDLVDTDPLLAALAANGGPTSTDALLPGSPAVNAGDSSAANCPTTDQRGVARPQGDACDIGAYEFPASAPTVVTGGASGVSPTTATLGGSVDPNAAATTVHFEWGTTTAYGHATPGQPAGSATLARAATTPVTGLPPGTHVHFRIVAVNAKGTNAGADAVFVTPSAPRTPVLRRLAITPSTFVAARRGPSATAARRARRHPVQTGALVAFSLDERARVTFTVGQPRPGRLVGRGRRARCVAPGRSRVPRGRRCTRIVVLGSFSITRAAGTNRLHFTGRVRGRALQPGSYRLTAVASASGRRSRAVSVTFRIRRAR